MLPRHALSRIMVWNAGDGPWWALTAEILKKQGSVLNYLTTNPTRPDAFVVSILIILTGSPQEEEMSMSRLKAYTLLIAKISFASRPKPWVLLVSLPKGGPKADLHPRPPDLHQNVPNIIANTPGTLMVPGRSFWKFIFWQGFPPCPPGHLPPQTECAGVLKYI